MLTYELTTPTSTEFWGFLLVWETKSARLSRDSENEKDAHPLKK